MPTLARIGIATATALTAGLVVACIGFLIVRVLVEHLGLVDGPPAAVLLVLVVTILALVGVVLGLVFSLRWVRGRSADAQSKPQ